MDIHGATVRKHYPMIRKPSATRSLLVIIMITSVASCATGSSTPAGDRGAMSDIIESGSEREKADFHTIYTLYSRAAYEAAISKLETFEKRYPNSPRMPQAENIHGLSLLLTKRPAAAVVHFKKALDMGGASAPYSQYLLYNLADAQFEAGQIEDAYRTAAMTRTQGMDNENRLKVHYLRARIHTRRNAPVEASRECLEAGKLLLATSGATNRETRSAVAALLEKNLKATDDVKALEELYPQYQDSTLVDQVLFRIGSLASAGGDSEKGVTYLQSLTSRFPDSPYYSQAIELLRSLKGKTAPSDGGPTPTPSPKVARDTGPVDHHAVGVLLPMTGKFGKFGARSLQGIELAFNIYNTTDPDTQVSLVIEDSGDSTESTLKALDKLVTRHHVVAVIGPLLSKGIDQVTVRAQELGVPLLSLARHPGIQSDFVFQAGLTLKLQAYEIARYAVEKLGIKRFAMVYPRDKVGEESVQRFWDAVEQLGGTVTGIESYNPGETDFRQPVDRLSGLYYLEARARELEALAKDRETNKIKKRTRKTEQYFSLKPIVDYEAVFVPEEPKVAGQILPTFAYRDVDKVKFLGASAWNSPELPERIQNLGESTFFLDAFLTESGSDRARKYAEKYRATYSQDPTAMDALAYDAAHIVEYYITKAGSTGLTRTELRDKMRGLKNFNGVTGKIAYEDGQFSRDLKILTVKAGKIVEASDKPVAVQ